jgi:hypothetical protein
VGHLGSFCFISGRASGLGTHQVYTPTSLARSPWLGVGVSRREGAFDLGAFSSTGGVRASLTLTVPAYVPQKLGQES